MHAAPDRHRAVLRLGPAVELEVHYAIALRVKRLAGLAKENALCEQPHRAVPCVDIARAAHQLKRRIRLLPRLKLDGLAHQPRDEHRPQRVFSLRKQMQVFIILLRGAAI